MQVEGWAPWWNSFISLLQIAIADINAFRLISEATVFAVSIACNTLLVVTAAVLVEVGAAIRGAARLVSATAAARHGCCRNFGARGLFGNGRGL